MTALAADRNTLGKYEGQIKSYLVKASTTIYKGAIVAVDATGFAIPAASTAGTRVVGVAEEQVIGNAGGTSVIRVRSGRAFLFNATAITQAMVGQVMYVVDDNVFDGSLGAGANKAGRLVEYVSATSGWIYIPHGGTGGGVVTADGSDLATTQALANAIKAAINAYMV